MSRPKKDYSIVSIKLEQTLYNQLSSYSTISHLSKTAIIELALAQYFALIKGGAKLE